MSSATVTEILQGAMTVRELVEQLQQLDPDAPVALVCDYGDYHHTQQVLPVSDCEEFEPDAYCLCSSGYSQSGVALVDVYDEEPDEQEPANQDSFTVVLLRSNR